MTDTDAIQRAHAAFAEAVAALGAPPSTTARPVRSLADDLADRIEHTCLAPHATRADVDALCAQARTHRFRGVCCLPRDVAQCADLLAGTGILVVTVVDFPLGASPDTAVRQARTASAAGADEIDMVVDLRALREHRIRDAADQVRAVVEAGALPVKVILETGYLSPELLGAGCAAAATGGAAFVKTSTGYGPTGASTQDVALLRRIVGPTLGIKAAGGIRTADQCRALLAAGADVLGTSRGPECVETG